MLDIELPNWTVVVFAAMFWLIQHRLRRFVRLWAFVTLPATLLHELAHALIGFVTSAKPSSINLWPTRVGATTWRLGYVGFLNLRWWNGGAVAMAPLAWLLVIAGLVRYVPEVPPTLALQVSASLGVGLVWLWIAVAPGRSDWTLARQYWPSAMVFLTILGYGLYFLAVGR
jgi:hypothetical protein